MENRRRAARLATRFRVVFRPGCEAYVGTVVSISRTGALVEVSAGGHLPKVGEKLVLGIRAPEPSFEIEARVVSSQGEHFAVEFLDQPVDLLDLLVSLG